jgi:branched-chain amino acid transport system ATP-binding protein
LATDRALALRLEGVHAFYSDSHVLHDVSFSLEEGRVLALLGRNGAGKTTSISTIVGFVKAAQGSISLFGERIEGVATERISQMGIGLVPQGRRVFPNLSVGENLAVAARVRAERTNPWTLARVFDLFPRLQERQKQAAGSLSGGEQQMLAIARALMGNPRVLLMDEPSEGLAPLIVAEVGATIARLKAEGQSIVLVEQNFNLALGLADHITVLNTGRVVFDGPADGVRVDLEQVTRHLGIF